MNKEIQDIFINTKEKLVEELTKYVLTRGMIECVPNTLYQIDEHLFPVLIDPIGDEVFVEYYDNRNMEGGQTWKSPLREFSTEQLYQIFNCAVEVTQNEITALKKALDESLEREKVAQKVIEDLRKRLNN